MIENPIRISSNMTLILALFLPTFWIVFFGLFVVAILISDQSDLPFPGIPYIRWILLSIFLLFFSLIYFTIMRLKRVEVTESQMFISNYLKTYRYGFQDIEKFKSIEFGLFEIMVIYLKYKGKFGRRIPFIINKAQLGYFLDLLGKSKFTEVLEK